MKHIPVYGLVLSTLLGGWGPGRAGVLYPPLEMEWQFAAEGGFYAAPTVVEGIVYSGALDHSVYALDAATGRLVWRFETGDRVYSGVTLAEGRAYVASAYALDAATGKERWRYVPENPAGEPDKLSKWSPLTLTGERLLFGSHDGHLYALDAATGKRAWSRAGSDEWPAAPVVAGELAYAGGKDGTLTVLDVQSGELIWQWS